MAITRAQQVRQMYKEGSMEPVEQAGVMNYMPSEMVTVPKIAKSSPDTPTAKLAYITPEEQDILIDLNLYGSLDGKPNRGPGGIPSLEGDFGSSTGQASTGAGTSGTYSGGGADFGGAQDSQGNYGDFSGARDTGTGNYVESNPDVSIDRQREFRAQQLNKSKEAEDRRNAAIAFEKQRAKTKKDKQKLEILKDLFEDDEEDVAYDVFDKNKDGKIGFLEGLTKKRTELAKKTLTNSIAQKLGIMPTSYVPSVLMSDMLRTTPKGVNIDTLDDMLAPDFDMGLYGLSGKDLTRAKQQLDVAKQDVISQDDFDRVYGNQPPPSNDNDGPELSDPCKGPNPPAYCFVDQPKDEAPTTTTNPFAFRFLADGGRAQAMDGGIMDADIVGGMMDGNMDEMGRQMYGLGKLVKKATRGIKKLAKSPLGKAALLYAGGTFLGGLKFAGGAGFGSGTFLSNLKSGQGLANLGGFLKGKLLASKTTLPGTKSGGLLEFLKSPGGAASAIGIASALPLLFGQEEEEDYDPYRGPDIDIDAIRRDPYGAMGGAYRLAADGGLMRTGYQEGGDAEPVAKKTMPLIDMDGKEKDYRETGGFVDMGRMERADDVPARLSKNEFVFTADAVRNAGEGDIDKGAEVMYNMMKNLEAGGEVSEESQGLEGARKMFQTSQRLEEVL